MTFGFVENYNSASGARQFDVLAEGAEIISNLDVFRVAGKNTPHIVVKTITVQDGRLNLNFRSDRGDAMVSGFHIVKK